MRLTLEQGTLELMSGHGVFEPECRSLMVADLHLGKGLSFRRQGLPVPVGTTEETLARLDTLIDQCRPRALYILGDLLHGPLAQHARLHEQLARWRARHGAIQVILITGNHDRNAGRLPNRCGIEEVGPKVKLGAWTLCHDDSDPVEGFAICGHTHPAIRIRSRGDSLYRPCFWLRAQALVIPALGAMTGQWLVEPVAGERCFIAAGRDVVEVPPRAVSRPPPHVRARRDPTR